MKPKKEFFTNEYDKKMKRLSGIESTEKAKPVNKDESGSTPGTRINKYMAESGMCSRREADKLVADGKVYIDGVQAVMGSKVLPGQKVTVKGQDIKKNEDLILIAFNKPVGIVSTTDKRDKDNIIDYIDYGKRIFPIGRLDKESEGLILLTNDGDIVNKILRAGNYHEKEYVVTVNKDITPVFLKAMSSGVPILDTVTRPCKIEQIDKKVFKIILTQGLNRKIRRMCEALGYRVRSLIRIRIMNIKLNHLKSGTYRNLTPKELEELRQMIADSSNAPRRDASVVEE
ncbi:MAG: 23S rRNA pseudouridine(2604) synthase RluF [Lachnospiraceae bacterium]|nr:23S rRNA pseudouridine(2604) synthase RluF [Lachnospiraceae bacterium]